MNRDVVSWPVLTFSGGVVLFGKMAYAAIIGDVAVMMIGHNCLLPTA